MPQKPEENEHEKLPERPLECSECKKEVTVHYTEIFGETILQTCMCADCPELQKRLHGIPQWLGDGEGFESRAGLACGNCGTFLDAVRMGNDLGCSDCYEVFEDVIIQELISSKKAPPRISNSKKSTPIHIGRGPGEPHEMSLSLRLLALNEELNETLKKEDYEQAAWLRDQIKALTEDSEDKNEQ